MAQMNSFVALPRSTPAAQCVSEPHLTRFERALACLDAELRGYMVLRGGSVVAEKVWPPYHPEDRVSVYSLSKMFTGTAIGLAVDEGLLAVEDQVVSFFKGEELPESLSPRMEAMQVQHLLTMCTGHEADTVARMQGPNWAKAFLSLEPEFEPGSHFKYNSGASYMLSAILQKRTGKTMLEYLGPRLFEPLGFDRMEWEQTPEGVTVGGWGIRVRMEDMAKLGQLYLDKGRWNGRQVLSEAWVEAATSVQFDTGVIEGLNPDWAQGYGYHLWMCRHGAYRADGSYCQYCVVLPQENAVVVVMTESTKLQPPLDAVWDALLPGLLPLQPPVEALAGKAFALEDNPYGLQSAAFQFEENNTLLFTLQNEAGAYILPCGYGAWLDSEGIFPLGYSRFLNVPLEALASRPYSATWRWEAGRMCIDLAVRSTPHRYRFHCQLEADGLILALQPDIVRRMAGEGEVVIKGR